MAPWKLNLGLKTDGWGAFMEDISIKSHLARRPFDDVTAASTNQLLPAIYVMSREPS